MLGVCAFKFNFFNIFHRVYFNRFAHARQFCPDLVQYTNVAKPINGAVVSFDYLPTSLSHRVQVFIAIVKSVEQQIDMNKKTILKYSVNTDCTLSGIIKCLFQSIIFLSLFKSFNSFIQYMSTNVFCLDF